MRFNPDIVLDSTTPPKSASFIDRTGQRFGRLVFLRFAGRKSGNGYWWLRCDCGVEFIAYGGNVTRGLTRSCGCLHSETTSQAARTHGETVAFSKSPEYACWVQIKTRCYNPNYIEFHLYGGRGIRMCDRWRESFEAFLADMGRKPSPAHSIDRYPDPDGHYEPSNCRWATATQQAQSRRKINMDRPRDAAGRFSAGETK